MQQAMKYDYVLVNWEKSVETFLEWAVECCGVECNSVVYQLAASTVDSMERLKMWTDCFDGDFDSFENTTRCLINSL